MDYSRLMPIGIGLGVVVAGLLAFPIMVAGTPDPCKAAVRVYAEKRFPPIQSALDAFGTTIAIQIGTEVARQKGTLQCYGMIVRAMRL